MALNREQIGKDRRIVNADWGWCKRSYSRWMRRQARRDPEGAPIKGYRGWVG